LAQGQAVALHNRQRQRPQVPQRQRPQVPQCQLHQVHQASALLAKLGARRRNFVSLYRGRILLAARRKQGMGLAKSLTNGSKSTAAPPVAHASRQHHLLQSSPGCPWMAEWTGLAEDRVQTTILRITIRFTLSFFHLLLARLSVRKLQTARVLNTIQVAGVKSGVGLVASKLPQPCVVSLASAWVNGLRQPLVSP